MNKAIDKMVKDIEEMRHDLICDISYLEDEIKSSENTVNSKKDELVLLSNIIKFLKSLKK